MDFAGRLTMGTTGFSIYINTLFRGPVPVERDIDGYPIVYSTQTEAERVIAEDVIDRCRQYLDGERTFDDAMTIEEYILRVERSPDGSIRDENGGRFGNQNPY